jgi:hypothetical protein
MSIDIGKDLARIVDDCTCTVVDTALNVPVNYEQGTMLLQTCDCEQVAMLLQDIPSTLFQFGTLIYIGSCRSCGTFNSWSV